MCTIQNFNLNNSFFAECLDRFNLIHPSDCVVERCESVMNSVLVEKRAGFCSDRIILARPSDVSLEKMLEIRKEIVDADGNPLCASDNNVTYNYICNGVYGDAYSYMLRIMNLENGAFNVGIATNDELVYNEVKEFYVKLYKDLMAYGNSVTQIDCCQDESNAYILSYRKER